MPMIDDKLKPIATGRAGQLAREHAESPGLSPVDSSALTEFFQDKSDRQKQNVFDAANQENSRPVDTEVEKKALDAAKHMYEGGESALHDSSKTHEELCTKDPESVVVAEFFQDKSDRQKHVFDAAKQENSWPVDTEVKTKALEAAKHMYEGGESALHDSSKTQEELCAQDPEPVAVVEKLRLNCPNSTDDGSIHHSSPPRPASQSVRSKAQASKSEVVKVRSKETLRQGSAELKKTKKQEPESERTLYKNVSTNSSDITGQRKQTLRTTAPPSSTQEPRNERRLHKNVSTSSLNIPGRRKEMQRTVAPSFTQEPRNEHRSHKNASTSSLDIPGQRKETQRPTVSSSKQEPRSKHRLNKNVSTSFLEVPTIKKGTIGTPEPTPESLVKQTEEKGSLSSRKPLSRGSPAMVKSWSKKVESVKSPLLTSKTRLDLSTKPKTSHSVQSHSTPRGVRSKTVQSVPAGHQKIAARNTKFKNPATIQKHKAGVSASTETSQGVRSSTWSELHQREDSANFDRCERLVTKSVNPHSCSLLIEGTSKKSRIPHLIHLKVNNNANCSIPTEDQPGEISDPEYFVLSPSRMRDCDHYDGVTPEPKIYDFPQECPGDQKDVLMN